MKSKVIIYPLALMLILFIPVIRYYVSTPGLNDCMTQYVKNMEASNYKWNIYRLNWGWFHIEPTNSNIAKSLEDKKVWEANWCFMNSWDLFSDFNNTIYCSMAYVINKAPIFHSIKKPLAIMKWEAADIFIRI